MERRDNKQRDNRGIIEEEKGELRCREGKWSEGYRVRDNKVRIREVKIM
jgi:hypothetical protein